LAELGTLIDFFEYNIGETEFFPQIKCRKVPKFFTLNNSSCRKARSGAVDSMTINGGVNIRSKDHTAEADVPDGQNDRGLPNFNSLIHQVSVKDTYEPKL